MAHHMEACPKDHHVEWKVFALLGDDTVFRERFHHIGSNCNALGVQTFQVTRIWNKALGKRHKIPKKCVPGTTRLHPKARKIVKKPEYDSKSSSRTIIWRQDFMVLFGSG